MSDYSTVILRMGTVGSGSAGPTHDTGSCRLWNVPGEDFREQAVQLPPLGRTQLATTHMGVVPAFLLSMTSRGAYTVIVGDSAHWPVPGSGLVSMQQTALLMMQRVLHAEFEGDKRAFALVLGQISLSLDGGALTAEMVGDVAVAASASASGGGVIPVHNQGEVDSAVKDLAAAH